MDFLRWVLEQAPGFIQSAGIILGLFFTGIALRAETRSRQVENLIRITEGHRELWTYFDERPQLFRLFETQVDLGEHPLTEKETRFVQFLINHLILTFRAQQWGLYRSPERLRDDIRSFFTLPLPAAAWERLRKYQDKDFQEFVQKTLPEG